MVSWCGASRVFGTMAFISPAASALCAPQPLRKLFPSQGFPPCSRPRACRGRSRCKVVVAATRAASPVRSSRTQKLSAEPTGWINSETLNLQEAVHESIGDGDLGRGTSDDSGDTKVIYPARSPTERLLLRDRLLYVKRDDLLHLPRSHVSGNKARKFLSLNGLTVAEFPEAVVSHGGPQSNAMVALAAVVSSKNERQGAPGDDAPPESEGDFWQLDVVSEEMGDSEGRRQTEGSSNGDLRSPSQTETMGATAMPPKKRFVYYTKPIPRYLRQNPSGNFLRALALGMELRTLRHDAYEQLFGGLHGGSVMAPADLEPPVPGKSLWVPQGGACGIARPGGDVLAQEVVEYWSRHGKGRPLAVCVPGGTCTTALLLHRSINHLLARRRTGEMQPKLDIRVVVIPCVGDNEYAMRQMMALDRSEGGTGRREDMPWVLRPRDADYGPARRRSKGYFPFGAPAKAILDTYDEMNEAGLYLDLLYGAPAWSLLLPHWRSRDASCPIAGRQVMYVHSGGLEGVASQLTRYKHKGLIDVNQLNPQ